MSLLPSEVEKLEKEIKARSIKIGNLQRQLDAATAARDVLLARGVFELNIPRSQLAEWASIRRESVYYAALRANQKGA